MEKGQTAFLIAFTITAIFVGTVVYISSHNNPKSPPEQNKLKIEQADLKPGESAPKSVYYYPIGGDYRSRLTFRWFGKLVSANEAAPDCGQPFSGYHNADDLEVTPAEKGITVPVYAITDGNIRQISNVNGYGGLLVMEANLESQPVTINYGHIALASAKVKEGDSVKAGQELALLGEECSAETDGERKHLHFAIHKGTAIDVRGYLPNQTSLASWINPKEFLADVKANKE